MQESPQCRVELQISYKKPRFVQKCPRILDLSLYVRSVQILRTAVRGATAPSLTISILHRWSCCAENLRRPARGPPPPVCNSDFGCPCSESEYCHICLT